MSSIESKRVQYRKYLERAGVIDALSKALIKLYEEQNKPEDAIRFVRKFMCESCPDDTQFDIMKADLEEARNTISHLEQELERLRDQIKKSPDEIAELLEEGFKKLTEDEEDTESLLRKYLTKDILNEYLLVTTPAPDEASLYDCVQAGFAHHKDKLGILAANHESYDVFEKLFEPIVKDYHDQLNSDKEQLQPDLDYGNTEEIENLDAEKRYILSSKIYVSRNITGYPFVLKMREKQFVDIEEKVKAACASFDGPLSGAFYSLNDIPSDVQDEMHKREFIFKKDNDFLQSGGGYKFWPIGRGIFYNVLETFSVWVNEEDHVRVSSMAKCGDLADVYTRLIKGLNELEKTLPFIRHPRYGYVTISPKNLGTAMHAAVRMRLPLLSQNIDDLKAKVNDLNLEMRGTLADGNQIEDGVMDISNKKCLGLTEFEIVKTLQEGVVSLIKAEEELIEKE